MSRFRFRQGCNSGPKNKFGKTLCASYKYLRRFVAYHLVHSKTSKALITIAVTEGRIQRAHTVLSFREGRSLMEGSHDSLPDKESLDNQHLRQKEQRSDWSFYIDIGKVQVLNNPNSSQDVGNQIHDYRNQQSASEKNSSTCTRVGERLSQEQIPFAEILSCLTRIVDKERGTQLEKLFLKLRKNEITRSNFLRLVKDIVGTQLFAAVVKKVQMKAPPPQSSVAFETTKTLLGKRRDQENLSEESATGSIKFAIAPDSKRQKTVEAISVDSVDKLNDVTAVVGINLREEEQKLFTGCVGLSANRLHRVVPVQEPLILQKSLLQRKLLSITSRCGVTSYSKDVECCLSLSVEERLRGLISNLIRISRKRVDFEKEGHKTHVTSDVRHQIKILNQINIDQERIRTGKSKGGYHDGSGVVKKSTEANEWKRRASALNVAALAAIGGEDPILKWKLMAMESLKKNERESGSKPNALPAKHGMSQRPLASRNFCDGKDSQEKGTKSPSQPVMLPQKAMCNTISIKDVIAVLELEPHKSKSSLTGYYLYERRDAACITAL